MNSIFTEITIIVSLSALFAIIFRAFRQPPILAYILTGIFIGALKFYNIANIEVLHTLGEFGITFLLFMLGLELKISELKSVGKVAVVAGLGQIVFTTLVGFGLTMLLGFSLVESLYISAAMTFSSTVIIVKLLSDKKDQNSLYGKISIGILLVQDFAAIVILILLSSIAQSHSFSVLTILFVFVKAFLLFTTAILASKYVLPKIINFIASSSEALFIFSIAFAFLVASIVASPVVGFSIEIGGLLAGLALANSSENYHIVARIRPLRDFFITLFFVLLGTQMDLSNIGSIWVPALVLSLFVLIGNPIIVLVILGLMGFHKRVGFLVGLAVAQISEFSLILIFLGNKLSHVNNEIVSLMAMIAIVTFGASTYMIINANRLYRIFAKRINIFEKRSSNSIPLVTKVFTKHIILIGANRGGEVILETLKDLGKDFLVVDFDPDVVGELEKQGYNVLFGDISDPETQEKAGFESADLVISSNVDREDNIAVAHALTQANKNAQFICLARDRFDAKELYKHGVSYVVIPRHSSGKYIAEILESGKLSRLPQLKNRDLKELM